jgi:di/tricarboxylate transporter
VRKTLGLHRSIPPGGWPIRSSGSSRFWLRAGGGLLFFAVLLLFTIDDSKAEPDPRVRAEFEQTTSHEPRFVSVHIRKSDAVLIAGESGFLEFDLSLPEPDEGEGGAMDWDREGSSPVLWVSSLAQSGIVFDDQIPDDKPSNHILVRLPVPEGAPRTLQARVKYSVDSRAKAGHHTLFVEVSVPLVDAAGRKQRDRGMVRSPFEIDTRLRVKLLMLLVIAVAVFLFIVEWVRVDVVAILMMVLLPELGLLDARDTFRGLSSNAVVAIIGVMIISFGLNRVGVVGRITRSLLKLVSGSVWRLSVVFSSLIAVISSVMQNTGAAVLFLPGIRIASKKVGVPLSRVLMPIGMAAILGGTLTMIGTSPLILLNDLLPAGMPKFCLLELTPIGIALVVVGIAYLSLAARYCLGRDAPRKGAGQVGEADSSEFTFYEGISGPYEIFVPPDYDVGSGPQRVVEIRRQLEVNIVAMAVDRRSVDPAPAPGSIISGGLNLLAYGPAQAVRSFVAEYKLELRPEPRVFEHWLHEPTVAGAVEIVISPRSSLVGKSIKDFSFRKTFGVSPLALHQGGKTYYREMADRPLQPGDAVLVHGTWEQLHSLQEHHQNFIIISRYETEFQKPEKVTPALGSFGLAMALMLASSLYFQGCDYNPIPVSVCLMAGALSMILTRVMTISEAYRSVDWRTVFLLGGLIPLGMAVSQTGTAAWIAKGIVGVLGAQMSPLLLLFVLAVLSCGFTLVISNVGACALLVPLGLSLAGQVGIDPRVAAIVVGIGVSNSFLLPTHQVNALYMGPGEYRTVEYLKIGGGLSLIYIAVLVTMTYLLYM